MTTATECTCGKEASCKYFDVPSLQAGEVLVHVLRSFDQLLVKEDGTVGLSVSAFRKEDLQGKKANKSVSMVREAKMRRSELEKRARSLTHEDWVGDPVVVRALAHRLQSHGNEHFSKCLCVFADPITLDDNDRLGECCAHVSMIKHCQFAGNQLKEAWIAIKSDLAELFDRPCHLISGSPVSTAEYRLSLGSDY